MNILGIESYEEYLAYLQDNPAEMIEFHNAMAINWTYFFRLKEHFMLFNQELIARLNAGQRTFRFWSAACSTGEEPYSLAMTFLETMSNRPDVSTDVKILATDLSTEALDFARNGVYIEERVVEKEIKSKKEGLSPALRQKYFDLLSPEESKQYHFFNRYKTNHYRVKPQLQKMVSFHKLNLIEPPPYLTTKTGKSRGSLFDVIFLRHTMIYFDQKLKERVIDGLTKHLKKGGLLFLGGTESLPTVRQNELYKKIAPYVYRLIG